MFLARRIAKALGPDIISAQRRRAEERQAALAAQQQAIEAQHKAIEAAVVLAVRQKADLARGEEARLAALEEEYRLLFGAGWRPQIFASTRGWIDVDGRPATQDMVDLHKRLKARDTRHR